MTTLLIALLLSTTTVQVGALAVETPEGFTRSGNRFVAERSQWVFDPETKTADPARWVTEAMSASMSGLREPVVTAVSHQAVPSGLEVWTLAGSGYDAQGHIVCILVVGVHDAATGRAVMTRLQTDSQERFEAGRKALSSSLKFLAFVGPPPAPAPAPAPAVVRPPAQPVAPARDGIPDGPYSCSRLSYVTGWRGNLEPSFSMSYIDNRVSKVILKGDRYEAAELKQGGAVKRAGTQLVFVDGPLAGWVAATGRNSTGPFFRVRGGARSDPGTEVKVGDDLCYGRR